MISSDSSDNPSSDYGELINGLNSEKPMARVFTLGKIHRALREFTDDRGPMNNATKRLLKGFYTQDRWELENDSEQESAKFNDDINMGKIKTVIMNTAIHKFKLDNRERRCDRNKGLSSGSFGGNSTRKS